MIEAYKVSNHRLYTGVVVTILVLFAMIFLFLICNAMSIMSAQEMAVSVDSLGNTVTVYNQFCVSIEYTCLPESLFNDCTYYGCSGFICPGTWT